MTKSLAHSLLDPEETAHWEIKTHGAGPEGKLPVNAEQLRNWSSGDLFGWTENAGMGWCPADLGKKEFVVLSMQGGFRGPDGKPLALAYSTGQWDIDRQAIAAVREISRLGGVPFASLVSEICDGRIQGNSGMMDSLPFRNDAAILLRRLIRTLPTSRGILGVATCDKGIPAMIMAMVHMRDLPSVLIPGGVTLPPTEGEDNGTLQSLPARFALGEVSLEYAQKTSCTGCGSSGGACQFLGTAATGQVLGEAMGLSPVHSALAPAGQDVWLEIAVVAARALLQMEQAGVTVKDIVTQDAIHNAMVMHAAVGGSMNFNLHLPAIAHAAGLRVPDVDDWIAINKRVPRLVDALPNGPQNHPTVRVFLAGGVPEVMLKLRDLNLLKTDCRTVTGDTIGELIEQWEGSPRRRRLREVLVERDQVDPDDVIMDVERAKSKGLTGTTTFPLGNVTPTGSVIKSTAIDPAVLDSEGIYHKLGPARVFTREHDAIEAIKQRKIVAGDILLLICDGPLGSGMEEVYQVTSALKHVSFGRDVALLTDARFSGVSTGACIGHIGPEALAGGPIGKVLDGDLLEIRIDTRNLEGSVNLVGEAGEALTACSVAHGNELLASRELRPDLTARADLPDDTRLWAALQQASGGTWAGCVYDTDRIIELLEAGEQALGAKEPMARSVPY